MTENNKFYVISHTHWDREWYESFQNYRFRLVRLMDDLLEVLENNDEYKVFHLDGQTIILEDYLEIRPENENRLRNLIINKRIIIGPWYVMPDEFLVSGESLVRNFQKGISICKKYNTNYMRNGYVTDIFGHNGQFPQILKGFGIDSATLFRGVGDYPKDLFNWEGEDGSSVTAFRMDPDRCYSNFYFSLRSPFEGRDFDEKELIKRAEEMIERSKKAGSCNAFLLMDGVDHMDADPMVPKIIEIMNEKIDGIDVKHAYMQEYIEAVEASEKNLDTMKGPLYNLGGKGLNNRVLKNVLSSMVHLKQANDACETAITCWAEPLDFVALNNTSPSGSEINSHLDRSGFITEAWKQIMQNHPHDSICGCSISDVHKDNECRFRQASQIVDRITLDAMEQISEHIDTSSMESDLCFTIFNPSQKAINDYTSITFDFPLEIYRNFKLFDVDGIEIPYQILKVDDLYYKRDAAIRKLIQFIPYEKCTVSAKLSIPGNGYTTIFIKKYTEIGPGHGEYSSQAEFDRTRYIGTMRVSRNSWDNGKIIMTVSSNGTLAIINKSTGKEYVNVLAFEDCADIGDGWDYLKPLMNNEYVTICGDCDFSVDSDGPNGVVISLTRRIPLPVNSSQKGRNKDRISTEIHSVITLIKNSNRIHVKTMVKNEVTNHRLRVLVPTGFKSQEFYTLTPFDMQKWPVKKADYSKLKENETFVNPTQGVTFIKDGKNSVELYTKGLYEVEICENDCAMALTLFRAFSNEVGQAKAEEGHMNRSMEFEYAIGFGEDRNPSMALLDGLQYKIGLKTCETKKHEGALPLTMSYLQIDCKSCIQSALYTMDEQEDSNKMNVVRLYNPSNEDDMVSIISPKKISSASIIDFNGNNLQELLIVNGVITTKVGPHKIITISFLY